MDKTLSLFEGIVRRAYRYSENKIGDHETQHPFEDRNIHPTLPKVVQDLFDNGHYAQATFEAFKFIDKQIQRISNSSESGYKLVMQVFGGDAPTIQLTPNKSATEKDEQKGYQFLFAGSILAVRNPRGHEYAVRDTPDTCLDHLALGSLLLRRLESADYKIKAT